MNYRKTKYHEQAGRPDALHIIFSAQEVAEELASKLDEAKYLQVSPLDIKFSDKFK